MKHLNLLNSRVWTASATLVAVAASVSGCAEPRTAYVPVYHGPPAYVVRQPYPPPVAYQGLPAPAQAPFTAGAPGQPALPTADWQAPAAAPAPVPAQAPPVQPAAPTPQQVVLVPSAPPPPLVEVRPFAPGAYYAWIPGYWSWNGNWVWVSGRWLLRPIPTAVWVGGHWSRHGRGWVWIGGGWR